MSEELSTLRKEIKYIIPLHKAVAVRNREQEKGKNQDL